MTRESNPDDSRIFATVDPLDVPCLAAFMADDIRLRLSNAEQAKGRQAFVDAVHAFLGSMAGVRHEVLDVWTDGDAVVAEFDAHYSRLGGQVTVPWCNLYRVRDGGSPSTAATSTRHRSTRSPDGHSSSNGSRVWTSAR